MRGIPIGHIACFARKSAITIRRSLYKFLDHPPLPQPTTNSNCHLIIDATWFGRYDCLIVYWDPDLKKVQWWRYTNRENDFEIVEDLITLKKAGVICSSVTSDGSQGVAKAVSLVYPSIPHQRCTTHVQRKGLTLLTQNPKTQAGKELRPLFKVLPQVRTKKDQDTWIRYFNRWCSKWGNFLKEKTYLVEKKKWWYKHKTLRRPRSLIQRALPNLFYYVTDKEIPKTTNGLEGRFGVLKQHYRQHRGLSKTRRESFLGWYLTLAINHEKPTRNDH